MKVVVIEPHVVVGCGLATMLQRVAMVDSSACYASPGEMIDACGMSAPPDVAIVSCSGQDQMGDEIRDAYGSCRIVTLVTSSEPGYLAMATKTRADGFLMLEDLSEARLARTLRDLMAGELSIPSAVASHLLEAARAHTSSLTDPYYSPRERDVIALLLEGLGNQEIALRLGISIHGVKRHVSSVLNKTNSPSRAHFVAHQLGKIPLPAWQ